MATDRSYVAENQAQLARLRALVDSLTDTELAQPMPAGWTVAGVLAHLAYWDQRIAEVSWAQPRGGWQQEMRATLQGAPGVVVDVQVRRVNSVYQNRKPWNRDTLFATGWKEKTEERSFYLPQDSCADYPARRELSGFLSYEYNGKIEPPNTWPPRELESVINASAYLEVPPRYAAFQ